jgi:signal transduction histidine kinase
VRIGYAPQALEIEVVDQGGTGRRDVGDGTSGGRGIIGMRERAALFGGTLEAGPTPTGFRVHATLPLDAPTAGDA